MSFSVIIRKTKAGDIFLYQFVLVISVCICIMRHRSGSKTTRKLKKISIPETGVGLRSQRPISSGISLVLANTRILKTSLIPEKEIGLWIWSFIRGNCIDHLRQVFTCAVKSRWGLIVKQVGHKTKCSHSVNIAFYD